MPSVFGNHEVQWQLFAEGALRNRVFHDDVMYRVKLVWPATGISITSTPPFRPKSTNTIIVICVFVPAAFCRFATKNVNDGREHAALPHSKQGGYKRTEKSIKRMRLEGTYPENTALTIFHEVHRGRSPKPVSH